jgi:hypothetical protein
MEPVSFSELKSVLITCQDCKNTFVAPIEKLSEYGDKCFKCGREFTVMVGAYPKDLLKILAGIIAQLEQAQAEKKFRFQLQFVPDDKK